MPCRLACAYAPSQACAYTPSQPCACAPSQPCAGKQGGPLPTASVPHLVALCKQVGGHMCCASQRRRGVRDGPELLLIVQRACSCIDRPGHKHAALPQGPASFTEALLLREGERHALRVWRRRWRAAAGVLSRCRTAGCCMCAAAAKVPGLEFSAGKAAGYARANAERPGRVKGTAFLGRFRAVDCWRLLLLRRRRPADGAAAIGSADALAAASVAAGMAISGLRKAWRMGSTAVKRRACWQAGSIDPPASPLKASHV